MKSVFLLSCLLVLSCGLFAQPFGEAARGFRIIRLDYDNSGGEKGSTWFEYNPQGQLSGSLWALDDSSRSSVNLYEYDEKGNLITTVRDFSEGRKSLELFFYDESGNKTSEYFFRSDSVSGFASYEYEKGILKTARFERYKGWLSGTLTFSCDKSGKKTSAVLTAGGQTACNISYSYDSYGNLETEHWDFGGRWSQTFRYFYEKKDLPCNYYTSPYLISPASYRISREEYTYNGETGGPSEYYYNSKSQLETKIFNRSDGLSTTTVYSYDHQGRLMSSKRDYSGGESGEFRYSYDENNHLTGRYFYMGDTLTSIESYIYDTDGHLLKASLRNFDGWLTGQISFTRDAAGRLTTGIFKGENGFDAFLTFTSNTEGLTEELRWDFSFGAYQLYRFSWEKTPSE
ncbi:MAG: hypothetical protein ACOYXB_01525 [Bacteroidota bacterium]